METNPVQAARYERIRRDHALEMTEDYTEAIQEISERTGRCRVADLSRHFGVSHMTVYTTLKRLSTRGVVECTPYRSISLTARGAKIARRASRRHRTVLRFLVALGVDQSVAAVDAEGIEHHISTATLRKLKEFALRESGAGGRRSAA
jgi:DtxR family manganese transport transcriptional regulator